MKVELSELTRAAFSGDAQTVAKLIRAGIDLEGIDEVGHTALTAAVEGDRREIVEILLHQGADPNGRAEGGWRPLQAVVDLLLDSHVQQTASPSTDDLRLGIAAILIRYGADPTLPDDLGRTALSMLTDSDATLVAEKLLDILRPPNRIT